MSSLVCAMSGEVPVEPVVSVKTGTLFEKRLIQEYVRENGCDPLTREPLALEDLVSVQSGKAPKPRPAGHTSLPGLLSTFQTEWDAMVLETYKLRELLNEARMELSHTLYQHDAACRVVAKLMKERDEARAALERAAVTPGALAPAPAAARGDAMEEDSAGDVGISDAVKARMTEKSTELSKARKKREAPPGLSSEEDVKAFTEKGSFPVHLSNPVTCLDAHHSNKDLVLTGGGDGKVVLFDISKGKAVAKMDGHSKKVLRTVLHPTQDLAFSASADKTVRVWSASSGKGVHTWKNHTGEVAGLTLHATGEYIVSAAADGTWAFHDIATGKCRQVVSGKPGDAGYSVSSFHPDGLLLGTGRADGTVAMWDVKSQQAALSFGGHGGPVSSLCFSENGYYLATCGKDGAKVWDLRKVAKQGANAAPLKAFGGTAFDSHFDYSGTYFAVAGDSSLNVYMSKSWNECLSLPKAHTDALTGVRFGPDASYIATSSKDRNLKIFKK